MSPLIKHRERLNLTQDELAAKSGVSSRTIQRIEAGATPKGYTLKALSNALGLDEKSLLKTDLNTKQNDGNLAKFINLSSLLFIFLPLGSIITPLIIMVWKKEFHDVTKKIVSIQILWTIVSFALIVLSSFIKKGFGISNQITAITMFFLLLTNVYIILRNTVEIEKNNTLHINLKFSFL